MLNSTYGSAWLRRSTKEYPAVLVRGRLYWVALHVPDFPVPMLLNTAQMCAIMPAHRDVLIQLVRAPEHTDTAPGWQGPAPEMPAAELHWIPLEHGMHAADCAV